MQPTATAESIKSSFRPFINVDIVYDMSKIYNVTFYGHVISVYDFSTHQPQKNDFFSPTLLSHLRSLLTQFNVSVNPISRRRYSFGYVASDSQNRLLDYITKAAFDSILQHELPQRRKYV